ncbi:hypothetical protein QQS21_008782 [Conoideocrella luteorostrata]|uniref:Uncharacterized protein n=1 Tax=Conoideocrella luteorostrata TaxID=1105319 RepID=A0AAJ0FQW2_9HYPO|nr:hypothetical protein QQS21_008782 [Conoideocrella luteorostrata]
MRLLQRNPDGNYSRTPDLSDTIPDYAVLSHTWGPDEVVFADLARTFSHWQRKDGYQKIEFCANQARRHGLQYFWVDTCCIDKSDSIELQTAIYSMFRWYRDAKRCYVFLADVSSSTAPGRPNSITPWEDAFRRSRWFTRGWTLQELIAPKTVDFYSKEGDWLGDKRSLEHIIRDVTGIPASALRGTALSNFPVLEREAWARNRQTKHEEDMAYSLFGIFDVHVPLMYGEGLHKAQTRLREEVQKATKGTQMNDFSVTFSLSDVPDIQYFVAREQEIEKMRKALSSDGSRCAVTLSGLGGIGKTQLAVAYAKRYRDEYSAIFWLNIKDEASVQQSFAKVATQISQQHPNASRLRGLNLQENHSEVVEAVKAWFSLPGNTRWLIIYDNYDNPRSTDRTNSGIDINCLLPSAYQGSIIVTTRQSQVDIGNSIRIRKLESMEDSLKILSSTSGRDTLHNGMEFADNTQALLTIATDIDARILVEKLDGLPLALATAGAYLRRVSTSLVGYLRLYEKSWARLHTSTPSLGSYADRTLSSTWQVSYQQVQEQNPLAAHLLRWWAYFNNEDLWFELIQITGSEGDPAWIDDLTDELKFNDAMGTLHDYGFVEPHTCSPDQSGSRGYSIHGCLHSWTCHVLNQEWDGCLGKLALECIASHVPSKDHPQFWLLQRRLLSHAIISYATIEGATIEGSSEDLSWAFHNLGFLYNEQGKPREAEKIYLRALQGDEKAQGPHHLLTLNTVNSLGVLYRSQGKLQEAEKMYLRALEGKERAYGPDHKLTLDTVNNLGVLYRSQGKLQEAEKMYLRALQGFEKAYGPDHTLTLNTVNNLGVLYADQSKLQEAENMHLRALKGKEKAYGLDHTSRLHTVNNLGILYTMQKKLQEAEKMYLRALQGHEKAYGPDHTLTLDTVNNLGVLYANQSKLQEAEKMFLRALKGKEKAYGPDHTSTLHTVNNLGRLYTKQNKLQEAEDMYLRALQGYEKTIGIQNISRYQPAISITWALGTLFRKQGRSVEARRYYHRAYNDLKELSGPSHQDVQWL